MRSFQWHEGIVDMPYSVHFGSPLFEKVIYHQLEKQIDNFIRQLGLINNKELT